MNCQTARLCREWIIKPYERVMYNNELLNTCLVCRVYRVFLLAKHLLCLPCLLCFSFKLNTCIVYRAYCVTVFFSFSYKIVFLSQFICLFGDNIQVKII